MSDLLVPEPLPGQAVPAEPDRDRRRAAISFAVAAGLHVAAALLVAFLVTSSALEAPLPPISVNILLSSSPALAGTGGSAEASSATLPGSSSGGAGSKTAGDGFVIPSPRSQPAGSSTAPATGSGFRTAGGTAGGGESLPSVQSTAPGATVAASQSGTSTGTGGSAAQRSGQGVTVGAPSAGTQKGLDLSSVDKAIAGSAGGSGGGTGASASGTGGASAGGSASAGSGIAGADYSVVFDNPDLSKGRKLVFTSKPSIPEWVGKQGLDLSVTVSFRLGADGLLTNVKVTRSSGYADVDAEVVKAIRFWRFTTARGAAPLTGEVPYKINSD